MNKRFWKITWFVVKLTLKYFPRVFVSPVVGAFRQVWETLDRADAELAALIATEDQRAERNPTRSFNA
jgi:hypothetical protein